MADGTTHHESFARRGFRHALPAALSLAMTIMPVAHADDGLPVLKDGARLEPVSFKALEGWRAADLIPAFAAFRLSCRAIVAPLTVNTGTIRFAAPPMPELKSACEAALSANFERVDDIRAFFERHFTPYSIRPAEGRGFLTGYYEPEVVGSLSRTPEFKVPILARPADLVTLAPGDTRPPNLDPELAAARRIGVKPDALEPFPDRAAIEDGALSGRGLEIVYLTDAVEAFMIHVQGSARVRLADGETLRLSYAGRNGHPYRSIGRILVAEGHMDLDTMTLDSLKGWLRAHPDDASRIMRLNRSYIFFERNDRIDPTSGPIGGSGVPLTPHVSIAIDRSIWSYGLPMYLDAMIPKLDGQLEPVRRLMVAQDTGTAIVGSSRVDYFMGSGDGAGIRAGSIRHPMDLTVLWPKAPARP